MAVRKVRFRLTAAALLSDSATEVEMRIDPKRFENLRPLTNAEREYVQQASQVFAERLEDTGSLYFEVVIQDAMLCAMRLSRETEQKAVEVIA